ncbi:MAG: hypothetical protein R3C61_04145 [Bacteroidia bacterium]
MAYTIVWGWVLMVFSGRQPVFQMADYAAVGDAFVISSTQLSPDGFGFIQTGAWNDLGLLFFSRNRTGNHSLQDPDNARIRSMVVAIITTGGILTCPGKWG